MGKTFEQCCDEVAETWSGEFNHGKEFYKAVANLYAQSQKAKAWEEACLAMRVECENKFQYQANQNKIHNTKYPTNPYKP